MVLQTCPLCFTKNILQVLFWDFEHLMINISKLLPATNNNAFDGYHAKEVAPIGEMTGQLPHHPASKQVENCDQHLTEKQSSYVAAAAEKVASHPVLNHERGYEEVSRKLPNSSEGRACQAIVPLAQNSLITQDALLRKRKKPCSGDATTSVVVPCDTTNDSQVSPPLLVGQLFRLYLKIFKQLLVLQVLKK